MRRTKQTKTNQAQAKQAKKPESMAEILAEQIELLRACDDHGKDPTAPARAIAVLAAELRKMQEVDIKSGELERKVQIALVHRLLASGSHDPKAKTITIPQSVFEEIAG